MDILKMIFSGQTNYYESNERLELKTWTVFWTTGKRERLEGDTISEAFTRHGYSAGALCAVDFYAKGDALNWHVLVDTVGKHDWVCDNSLDRYPTIYTRVDAAPPQMTTEKWVADHYYIINKVLAL